MNKQNKNMTYSQRKRAKLDYRAEYFKHNPGLFGCIWICAYCGAPLLGAHNVVIDHIMPLNSPLGMNNRFNLVASCQKCNLEKSDAVDYRVVKGYTSKFLQSILFTVQKGIVIGVAGIWWGVHRVFSAVADVIKNLPLVMKLLLVALVICAIVFGRKL